MIAIKNLPAIILIVLVIIALVLGYTIYQKSAPKQAVKPATSPTFSPALSAPRAGHYKKGVILMMLIEITNQLKPRLKI